MFGFKVEVAKYILRDAIETVYDIESLKNGVMGALPSSLLIAWYRTGTASHRTGTYRNWDLPEKWLLSSFVARELGRILGPGKLRSIARCIVDNPSHDGRMFELLDGNAALN